jgi:hypothetical protein
MPATKQLLFGLTLMLVALMSAPVVLRAAEDSPDV